MHRVSYCTVDPYYDKVFCYISRNSQNKQLECHAFLCSKKSKAEAITLTVAQAFNIAFERWQAHKKRKDSAKKAREEVEKAAAALGGEAVRNGSVPRTESPPQAQVKNDSVDDLLGECMSVYTVCHCVPYVIVYCMSLCTVAYCISLCHRILCI